MGLKNKTILLVEDDLLLGQMIERRFLAANAHLIWAQGGEEAIEELKKETIDFIITDLMMSKMDGYELIQRIRKNKKTENVPIVIFTNLTKQPEDIKKMKDLKILDYIIKSDTKLKDLIKKLDAFL